MRVPKRSDRAAKYAATTTTASIEMKPSVVASLGDQPVTVIVRTRGHGITLRKIYSALSPKSDFAAGGTRRDSAHNRRSRTPLLAVFIHLRNDGTSRSVLVLSVNLACTFRIGHHSNREF